MIFLKKYRFSAVIPFEKERKTIFDQIIRRFATSYSMLEDTIHAEYVEGDPNITQALIMTFEKYAEHEISCSSL